MKVSIWDTYVHRKNGTIMHFDIVVSSNLKDEQAIFEYGKEFLKTKPHQTDDLTTEECRFCHIEQATHEMISEIEDKGYFIIEMENCD
ncbi:DUF2024 family protein [Aquimarina mytili]|uniref:DUF2024 family protein n=1 Tax=Aquimarina mytili TaxID=874423 RepID=A0A936ZQR9_9FLAO|nr:DUF2024 family protein [Aquimarina mytili]MBL0683687.1 DUF2024 family protein [Aquimarina mytili]